MFQRIALNSHEDLKRPYQYYATAVVYVDAVRLALLRSFQPVGKLTFAVPGLAQTLTQLLVLFTYFRQSQTIMTLE